MIKNLLSSHSFSRSRITLLKLSEFEEFTPEQLNDIAIACRNNSQIYMIRKDSDIQEIITKIIKPNRDKIESNILEDFDETYDYAK